MIIKANVIDLHNKEIYPGSIEIVDDTIIKIIPISERCDQYILPGFIDAHIHIESSLLVPSEFARMAVIHGTVGTVSDPHEIANVLGVKGVEYMIENAAKVPFHFHFGAPSCVPATSFETAGEVIDAEGIAYLFKNHPVKYLAEMMNYPGVLNGDEEIIKKMEITKSFGYPIDGHAPGLMGEDAIQYFEAGPSTDHECFKIEEAIGKLKAGVKILIREGSAARNFDELIPCIKDFPEQIMFCSDDKHPDSLIEGHINQLVKKAIEAGYDLFDVLKAACINPVEHYKMEVGQLKVGDAADFIVIDDLKNWNIKQTYIKGELVSENGKSLISGIDVPIANNFNIDPISIEDLNYQPKETEAVIECLDGQLITNKLNIPGEECICENDILKIVVVNRYSKAKIAIGFIKNMGIKNGAMGSSVAHDSHNIIAVGTSDDYLLKAINLIIDEKGGLSAVSTSDSIILPLPVAGLMSDGDAWKVTEDYIRIDNFCKNELGSPLRAPFMSLSFMALLVIPELKLSDKGMFDGKDFKFI